MEILFVLAIFVMIIGLLSAFMKGIYTLLPIGIQQTIQAISNAIDELMKVVVLLLYPFVGGYIGKFWSFTGAVIGAIIGFVIGLGVRQFITEQQASNPNPKIRSSSNDPAETYRNAGIDKSVNGFHSGAIDCFTRAIDLDPKNPDNFSLRAKAKERIGDFAGAVDDFTKAIQLDQKSSSLFTDRAEVKKRMTNYAGAIEDYTHAIQIAPQDKETAYWYLARANVKHDAGDIKGWRDDKEEARRLDPTKNW